MEKEKQFDSFYKEHWYRIYTYTYNIVRDRDIAQDITQEVFIDLWKRFDVILDEHQYYLMNAAKYQCFNHLRNSKFKEIQIEKIEFALESYNDDQEKEFLKKEKFLKKLEKKAKEELPSKCYKVYQLRYHYEKSYKEIAKELGISIHTVDNHLKKALRILRKSVPNTDALLLFLIYSNYLMLDNHYLH